MAEKWWIASYSALATLDAEGDAPAPASEPISAEEATLREGDADSAAAELAQAAPAAGSLHAFPRGPNPGSFLHGLLEWAADEGFAAVAEQPEALRDLIARRCQLRGWEAWIEPLAQWLPAFLQAELAVPGAAPVQLAALASYQKEMEFWFAVKPTDSTRLDAAVRAHVLPGETRPALQPTQLGGMLKGFIDLVFEHEGRYYVADYKSNWLGPDAAAYTAPALRAAVLEHRYDLQYALYLFALHRLLKARLADYDYDRHIGGALYLFLRGGEHGVFHERPPKALMEALEALFSQHAEEVPA
ncbi:hypothetical protein HMPREF3289_06775 [Pseudomonas sp. HMSC75E02]|nr:hypothetical protein HMPREF3289_06775 [Pseudomonas sp. HMSC75E02]